MKLRGIDGCRAGWLVAESDHGHIRVWMTERLADALDADRVVIDIPIGLPDRGSRRADLEARKLLSPHRHSSVFPSPIRPALSAPTREAANTVSRAVDGRGVGAQAFGIYAKVAEADGCLQELRPDHVAEGHPELSFRALNGDRPLADSKHTQGGIAVRSMLLEAAWSADHYSPARAQLRKAFASDDDILDALALLWTADRWVRGEHGELPKVKETDATGLPMRMIY